MFLHLPSLKSLGLDVRTDVSVLLTLFLLSLLVSFYDAACSVCCNMAHAEGRVTVCSLSMKA